MGVLRIINLSSFLSAARFEVRDEAQRVVYQIKESPSSSWMKLVRLTKFRLAFPLKLEIMDSNFNLNYVLFRKGVLVSGTYQLLYPDQSVMVSFEERRIWRRLPFIRREILDEYGRPMGSMVPAGIGPRGSRSGVIRGVQGGEISRFEWRGYSFLRGYKECVVYIYSEEERWIVISLVLALIKGLYLHYR